MHIKSPINMLFVLKHLFYIPFFFFAVGVEMGDWQEVWDENSGCYYYWNTLTNEVSWELPRYLADQVQSLGLYANRWEKLKNYDNFEA